MDLMRRYTWLLGAVGGLMVISTLIMRRWGGVVEGPWIWSGFAGAGLLLLYLWSDRESVGQTAASRSARYTSGAILAVFVALGITIASNVIVQRYDTRWDLTSGGRHTLAPQSVEIAQGLTAPVTLVGFFGLDAPEGGDFEILAEGYALASDQITVERLDPNRDVMAAQRYEIDRMGTVIVAMGDKTERLEDGNVDEEAITNALVRLTSSTTRTVCFTSGHEERRTDDEDVLGLSGVAHKLSQQGTTIQTVQLARDGDVRAACEVVVVADPQVEPLAQEREILARWVRDGGALMVLLDPVHTPIFAADLGRYGISVGDDVVVEDNPTYQMVGTDPTFIILDRSSLTPHPMVGDMDALVVLRAVRSVAAGAPLPGIRVTELARTSEAAWGETDYMSGAAPQPDPGERIGPVPVMAVAEVEDPGALMIGSLGLTSVEDSPLASPEGEAPESEAPESEGPQTDPPVADGGRPGGRVLVVGDSDFAANQLVANGTNQDLFLNGLAWLLGEEDAVTIRPNEAGRGTLEVTAEQSILVALVSLVLVPGLAILGGIGTAIRRRRL